VNNIKKIDSPTKKIRRYTSSALLLHTAAQALGYTVREVMVNGQTNLSRYGFFVEHNNKRCYISAKSYFPNVPRWQLALMDNKLITTAILEQSSFSTIKTILFTNKESIKLGKLTSDILNQPLPILIKPTSGQDGSGVKLCYTKKQTTDLIVRYYAQNESFLAQPFINKDEYRITVVDKEIMFIHLKRFPTVTGDGIKTVRELISKAKYTDESVIEQECQKQKITLDTILKKGTLLKTHITKKSDPSFYITKDFPVKIKEWVTRLCTELGIESVGIDVFIKGSFENPSTIMIIELNSKPGLSYITKYYKDKQTPHLVAMKVLESYFK
jgi:D-alanine-D-alanine ligase-like ATP-grasp enzyme